MNTSPFMVVEREELLYTLESLVAEFGGTLSLFLGLSFMTLWDGVELIKQAMTQTKILM